LARAIDGAQALGYTVTRVEGERSRFEAEHGGRSFASLFGSDSNCRVSVRTAPAPGMPAARIFVEGEAHDAGSFAGCRKDADAILAIATGDRKPPRRPPPSQVPGNPDAALHGGTFGGY